MKHLLCLSMVILCGVTVLPGLVPSGAAAGDEEALSMIIASDLHLGNDEYIPPPQSIQRNQLVSDAMNNIGELGKWPAQDSSRLIYGYDAPIIDPSGVIVNGDLTHGFKRYQHQAFIDWRNSIQWDMYTGLGNHGLEITGPYDSLMFFVLGEFGDSLRARKEAAWWMANLIEKEYIPNIVNRDLNGFVGLRNELWASRSRIGIGFWTFLGPDNKDSMFVTTWSDPIPSQSAVGVSHWGFVRIPDRAEWVYVQKRKSSTAYVDVASFPVPEPWQAQCYRVYRGWKGPKADKRSRPREWPNGDIESLAYSFDIGPYYHFVQLQNRPIYTFTLPERKLGPQALDNADDAFYCLLSPALELSSSIEWLKEDLKAATEAGKYIVINSHFKMSINTIGEAIKDRNVVALFHGDSHGIGPDDTISNTYNDSVYEIPVFDDGATLDLQGGAHLKFLLTSFHQTYFNVGVIEIDSITGQHAFVVDDDELLAETFMIPKMFLANADPTVTASLTSEPLFYEGATLSFLAVGEGANGDTLLYEWDFGDGNHSSGENPVHIYGDNGNYTVTVTADDQNGGTGTDAIQVTVENAVPTAAIDSILGPAGGAVLAGKQASFYASFSDPGYLDNHTARWDFGDGNTEDGTVTEENELPDATGSVMGTHTYSQSGTFAVLLHVQDDDGGEDTVAIDVMVMSPLEPDLVEQIDSVIQSLPPSCFKGPAEQHKIALSNKLAALKKSMAAGSIEGAINKLNNDIRAKMDGFVDGSPQDDWIIDEEAQVELCELIDQLIDYLESGGAAGAPRQPLVSNDDEEFGDNENLPAEFVLLQNNPNPFNPVTRIPFTIPQASYVTLEVFNITGQKVATLVDGQLEAGEHAYWFDGSSVASGVYVYRLQAGDFVETRRMLLLK